MLKKEIIWREILYRCFDEGSLVFTQKDLASKLGVSLSTVYNALELPRASGAIEVSGRNFRIRDKEKFLILWATHRTLKKDILYQTNLKTRVSEIEGLIPPEVIFAAFSAYARKYQLASTDYDVVYVYSDPGLLPEIKKRFPLTKGQSNLIVLKSDPLLKKYGAVTPDVQTFVDLWNLPQWYAKDFLNDLRIKLNI